LLGLLLTVSSNILGIVFVPLLLSIYLAGADLKISPDDLIIRLVYTVFIPSICGIAARRYSSTVSDLVVRHKVAIGLFSNVNLICIVWMALSKSRSVIVQQSAGEIVCLIVATVLQHCFYLAYNYILLRQIGIFPLKQMIAVLIMASQKSSPVALAVVTNIASDDNDRGLLTIPCVIGQLAQIFIGSFIANRFALIVDEQGRKEAKAEAVRPFVDAEASNTIELSPLNNMR
jgi:sodium/bile acid cotransporter 7